jgi:DNA-binding MarR family transcriptional regulator
MVSALVDDGLARRLEDKTDGRGVLVAVTAKGRRSYQRAHQQRLTQLTDALKHFSPDQLSAMRGLAEALERLTTVLDE